jgi:hypothetical protein
MIGATFSEDDVASLDNLLDRGSDMYIYELNGSDVG